MHAIYVAVAAWCLSLPVVFGVGIKDTPVGSIALRATTTPIKFRNQNSQVPFYNNILGYALDVAGQNLFLTSGLFHTAWKCDMTSTGQKIVSTAGGGGSCTKLSSRNWGNYYLGDDVNDIDSGAGVGVVAFNAKVKGTAASWNFESFQYGFGWGRSIAAKNNNVVAVGCPGCTGKSENSNQDAPPLTETAKVKAQAKRLSGLVFEYTNVNTAPSINVKDTSYSQIEYYGPFDFKRFTGDSNLNNQNLDQNCASPKSGCSLGTAVHYRNNDKLIATRGRSTRSLARAQGYLTSNACTAQLGDPLPGLGYCQIAGSVHFAIGDALDISLVDETRPTGHGTDKAKQFTLEGWGYNKNKRGADVFGSIDDPKQTPYHSRFGQAVESAKLFSARNGNLNNNEDTAFGAPGYGSYGAVFVFE